MDDAKGLSCRSLASLAAVLAVVMFAVPLFLRIPLLDPDEGLHAAIAQEMVASGNWITPRFLDQPFLDKPILYFWAQAASLAAFGPSEWAVRLPGLLFGFLGMVTTGLLAARLFDRRVGWIAAILYSTTILPTAMAQAPAHDVALIPWVNLSLLLLWEAQGTASTRRMLASILGVGLFLGLSILTKGFVGVGVVGLAFGSYLLLTRQVTRRSFAIAPIVIFIAVAVAAPWYLAVNSQKPGFLHYYIIERHVMGAATDSQPHGHQPWWYYLPILLGGGLPWIGYLPSLIYDAVAKRSLARQGEESTSEATPDRKPMTFLWCWLIGWTLFVTVVQSKLATYLWPAMPALAILAAIAWQRCLLGKFTEPARREFARTFVGSSLSGPIVLPAVTLVVEWMYAMRFDMITWLVIGLIAAASPLPLLPWFKGRRQRALTAACLSVAAQFLVTMGLVLPSLADRFSARELASHFNRTHQVPTRLLMIEERLGSLVFYLEPRLRASLRSDQFQEIEPDQPMTLAPGDVVVMPEHRAYRLKLYPALQDRPYDTVGRHRLYQIQPTTP